MSAFGEFLRRVRLKSIKVGPVTWDVLPPKDEGSKEKSEAPKLSPTASDPEVERDISTLDDLIHALENFHSNPEGIYYIGQTLVRCDSFLDDNRIVGEPTELTAALIEQLDNDPRKSERLSDTVGWWQHRSCRVDYLHSPISRIYRWTF